MPSETDGPPVLGLWHVALNVRDLEAAKTFYVDRLGFEVEWAPDPDNLYLRRGRDNLALHRSDDAPEKGASRGSLDHIGLVVPRPEDVDAWATHLRDAGVRLETEVKTHRDGARSFYLRDPEGNGVQVIYHPPISD